MSDVMEFVQNEDGTFSAYDDTYDIVIHCKSEDEQKKVIERLSTDWIPVSERLPEKHNVIRQIKRCLFRQIKTGLSEHLTMG